MLIAVSKAQLPSAYYSFENGVNGVYTTSGPNLYINSGGTPIAFSGVGNFGNSTGAGVSFYGGSNNGKALTMRSNLTSSTDPREMPTHYIQFKVNASGLKTLQMQFDVYANSANTEYYGVDYSTDGTNWTFIGSCTTPGTGYFPFPYFFGGYWDQAYCYLPSSANNQSSLYIRIYGYYSGGSNSSYYLKLDNITMLASATVAGAVATTIDEEKIYSYNLSTNTTGTVWAREGFNVDGSGTDITLGGNYIGFDQNAVFSVTNNATLEFGTSAKPVISLPGYLYFFGIPYDISPSTFSTTAGSTIKVTSADGITNPINTFGTTQYGNVQNFGTRTYDAGTNYQYIGSVNQVTGNGLPTSLTGNVTINNSSSNPSVKLTQTTTENSYLFLTKGSFSINGNTLSLNGNVTTTNGSIYGTSTSNLSIGGTSGGNLGTLYFTSGAQTLNQLTMNRIGINAAGTLGTNLTVVGLSNFNNGAFEINGNTLTLNGTESATNGTISGSVTSTLNIGGTANSLYFTQSGTNNNYLKNFTITGTATLQNALNITGSDGTNTNSFGTVTVTGSSKSLDATTNGYLTLKSDAYGDARVGTSTGSVNGNVTVERYIPALRAWRFLNTPYLSSSETLNTAWQEGLTSSVLCPPDQPGTHGVGTEITCNYNGGANGYDNNITTNPSIKVWSNNAWTTLSSPNGTKGTLVTDYPAYCLFVRGDRYICLNGVTTPNTTTLRANGNLNESGGSVAQNYTGNIGDFMFIGNPYASSVDLATILSTGSSGTSGISGNEKFWVWDPTLTGNYGVGGYVSFSNGIQSPLNPDLNYTSGTVIQSGQAFFVQTANTSASVNFKQTDKTASETNVFGKQVAGKHTQPRYPVIYMNLMAPVGDSLALADGVAAAFSNKFSAAVDQDDAQKLFNFDENLELIRDNNKLAIEFRPIPKLTDTLFLRMYLSAHPYSLQVFSQNLPGSISARAWIVDQYLNTQTEINLYDTTLYNFTPVTDSNGKLDTMSYRNRFMLVFNKQFKANPIPVSKVVNQGDSNVIGVSTSVAIKASGVSVYPNPVSDGKAMLQFTNMDKGIYEVSVYNTKGQKLLSKTLQHAGGDEAYQLLLNTRWAAGVYNVAIYNEDSKKMVNVKLMIDR